MGKRTNTATWNEKYNRWQINVQKDGYRRSRKERLWGCCFSRAYSCHEIHLKPWKSRSRSSVTRSGLLPLALHAENDVETE